MNADSIQDSTRYVVNTLHRGGILPGNRMEMGRDVYLDSGADVRGGVWCGSLAVSGPNVNVTDAVYCLKSARIEAEDAVETDGEVTFGSCFTSSESLVIQEGSPMVRFMSDIYTSQLNISNAFVYGNVFANRAVIRDSIVLGCVFSQSNLDIERSLVSTFSTDRAKIGEGTGLLFPYAVANKDIDLQAPVRALTFYSLYGSEREQAEGELVLLDEDDIIAVTVEDDENQEAERRIYCLSMMERILDSEQLVEHLKLNKKFIECLSLQGNLTANARPQYLEATLQSLESALWDVLRGDQTSSEQRANVSIRELMTRLSS